MNLSDQEISSSTRL